MAFYTSNSQFALRRQINLHQQAAKSAFADYFQSAKADLPFCKLLWQKSPATCDLQLATCYQKEKCQFMALLSMLVTLGERLSHRSFAGLRHCNNG